MRSHFSRMRLLLPCFVAAAALTATSNASADSGCTEGRCSTAEVPIKLEGKEALHTSIDTGWMPSCANGVEHCNKGLQVRASIALTAVAAEDPLFTAGLGRSAKIQASWENGNLSLRTESTASKDATLTVKHSLTPQVELYLDIGPLEQGWTFSATRLLQMIPGSRFEYSASASAPFAGWAFDGASVVVPAPALQNAQLFSVQLAQLSDVIGKVANGSLSIHALTSPTVTYKTTKVIVSGRELHSDSISQMPFPAGDFDFLDLPATIEGELTAKGDIDVLPAATLSNLGDANFSPPMTITFSSVKATKHYDSEAKKYVFPDKTVHIPLPNVKRLVKELDGGDTALGAEGTVPSVMENSGEARLVVRLESSDPRFEVSKQPVEIAPKSSRALAVTFRPDALGPAEATITAHTNDPDTPELTFHVRANGVEGLGEDPNDPTGKAGSPDAAEATDGCGCKTTGSRAPGYAGLFAFALGLAAFVRRRR